jgi:mycofactocin system glycosyltransferase
MKGFRLALAVSSSLIEGPGGYCLVSRQPLRVLRVNRALFEVLEQVCEGRKTDVDDAGLLAVLLDLAAKGYLEIQDPPALAEYPPVSIIIPVKDQPVDLRECLRSLEDLDWPADRRETIVVDDDSAPPVAAPSGITVLRHDVSLGPASCRNLGARLARGEILAFLDADCLAGEGWLRELVPFFRAAGVGAVGGYVAGYYRHGLLDRYEDACSSLNMGRRLRMEGRGPGTFYVPTANMLVRRDVFMSTGGFEEGRRIGEDVDLCWRLRGLGHGLVYAPFGQVAHKHRNRPGRMLRRRAEYGASEAGLYRAHRDKRKAFVVPFFAGLSFLAVALAILLTNPYPLIPVPFFTGLDVWRRSAALKKTGIAIPVRQAAASTFRSDLAFFYYAFFHLARYYLVPLLALGFFWHPFWAFAGLTVVVTSVVDFFVKKPRLPYPVFLFFYLLEHLAYQAGVFLGCLKARSFGSYRLSFRRGR